MFTSAYPVLFYFCGASSRWVSTRGRRWVPRDYASAGDVACEALQEGSLLKCDGLLAARAGTFKVAQTAGPSMRADAGIDFFCAVSRIRRHP